MSDKSRPTDGPLPAGQKPVEPPVLTEDRLLGGRVLLRQPIEGLRATIDPIFLAASVPTQSGEAVLELGTGTGVALLCLAARVPDCRVVGLEIQRDLVRLAAENAALNGFTGRVDVIVGDVADPPPRLSPGGFDHVMANPPFAEARSGTSPPGLSRSVAMVEGSTDLGVWVTTALAMVRSGGTITFVHRADRLDALLAALSRRTGEIVVFPLWPGIGKPAKRVLVRARRDSKKPLRLAQGLLLHEADGRYTAASDAVLRGGAALDL